MSEEAIEAVEDDGIVYSEPEDETAESEQEETQAPEPETAEAETEEAEEEEKVIFTPEQQEVFNREIGKKVAKEKEAQRQIDEYKAQLEAYQQKANPQPNRVDVPDYPDKYDDNFEQRLQDYNKAVAHNANMDFQEQLMAHAKQTAETKRQTEAQQKQETVIKSFTENATKLGVNESDLEASLDLAAAFNLDAGLREYILQDPLGPQVVVSLAADPANLETFSQMSPLQAVAHIEGKIKPNLGPKPQKRPPPPPKHLKGRGAPEGDGGPAGATYE